MAALIHPDELLSAYLDGELSGGELEAVAEHLSDCIACIAEFRRLKEARTAVRLLPRLELPNELAETIGVSVHLGGMLSAFLDGELSPGESQRVHGHLGGCGHCRDQLRELDAARMAVRAMPSLEFDMTPRPIPLRRTLKKTWVRVTSVAAAVILVVAVSVRVSEPQTSSATVDLDSLTVRHVARTSVDNGVAVVPAGLAGGGR